MANLDLNKYSKNKDLQPESSLGLMIAVVRMGLMLVGIVGLGMELFSEGGWLTAVHDKLLESTTNMIFIPVIIFVLWLLNRLMSSTGKTESNKKGEIPMYIMMAIGAYYLFKFITVGLL